MRRAEADVTLTTFEAEAVGQTRDLFADIAPGGDSQRPAIVPAEIRRSSSADSAAMQASASGSFSTIDISADVSTAIM